MSLHSISQGRQFLGDNPLFHEIQPEDLDALMALTKFIQVSANKVVIHQGDIGDDMYFIQDGSVYIRLQIADNEELTIGELFSGEAFGEIALFDRQPRTASVVTAEPCEFLVLTRDVFHQFLSENPHVAIQLLTVMSRRIRAANDFLKESMYSDVTSRLAQTLRKIAKAYGKHTTKGLKIDIEFADKELGEYAGIPADIVSAQLKHWQKAGIIKINHGCLTLIKPEELSSEY